MNEAELREAYRALFFYGAVVTHCIITGYPSGAYVYARLAGRVGQKILAGHEEKA